MKTGKQKWLLGIDPGFTETALVIRNGRRHASHVTAWATFSLLAKDSRDMSPAMRTISLASSICECIVGWVSLLGIDRLEAVVELPILRHNPQNLMLQMRLVQQIEAGLFGIVAQDVDDMWLSEISPTQSKAAATNNGRADKAEILAASPFADSNYKLDTRKSLADAWAHSLCAFEQHKLTAKSLVPVFAETLEPTIPWTDIKEELDLD